MWFQNSPPLLELITYCVFDAWYVVLFCVDFLEKFPNQVCGIAIHNSWLYTCCINLTYLSVSASGSGGEMQYPPDVKYAFEELCPVCGDKVSGYHYGLLTCESCKGKKN